MADTKCKFEHDGDCCNSGATQYMCKCKQPCYEIIPMTNADRIRSMTDEELAQYLVSVESRRRGDGCGAIWGLPYVALDWLQQPAEVE